MTLLWNFPTLLLTLIVEGAGLLLWNRIKGRAWKNSMFALVLVILLLVNLCTQGILYAGLVLSPFPYWPTLLALELVVFLLEAAGYRIAGLPNREAFELSLVLNLASFLVGLALPV